MSPKGVTDTSTPSSPNLLDLSPEALSRVLAEHFEARGQPSYRTHLVASWLFEGLATTFGGMTNLPEARLAREAELPYATIALATDYDCWHQGEEAVTVEAVLAVIRKTPRWHCISTGRGMTDGA